MRNFIDHGFTKLKRIDTPDGRLYETPSGESYPSVTTVTGLHSKQSIMEWRKKVGEEEAIEFHLEHQVEEQEFTLYAKTGYLVNHKNQTCLTRISLLV